MYNAGIYTRRISRHINICLPQLARAPAFASTKHRCARLYQMAHMSDAARSGPAADRRSPPCKMYRARYYGTPSPPAAASCPMPPHRPTRDLTFTRGRRLGRGNVIPCPLGRDFAAACAPCHRPHQPPRSGPAADRRSTPCKMQRARYYVTPPSPAAASCPPPPNRPTHDLTFNSAGAAAEEG